MAVTQYVLINGGTCIGDFFDILGKGFVRSFILLVVELSSRDLYFMIIICSKYLFIAKIKAKYSFIELSRLMEYSQWN